MCEVIRIKASGEYSFDDYALATPSALDGIGDILTDPFSLYPNPVEDYLIIDIDSEFQSKVYSVNGTLLLEGNNQKPLDLSNFSRGIYLLHLIIDEKLYTKKIIKK